MDIPSHMYNAGVGVGRAAERAKAVAVLMGLVRYDDRENECWDLCENRPHKGGAEHSPACQAARAYIADAESAKPEGGNV